MSQSVQEASTSKLSVSIEEISPLPKVSQLTLKRRKGGKKGKMGIINTTPDIEAVKVVENAKLEKERAKLARAAKRKVKVVEETSDEENTQVNLEECDDEDIPCLYCNELYSWSKSREFWLKCQACGKWAHGECAGKTPKTKNFVCELCDMNN